MFNEWMNEADYDLDEDEEGGRHNQQQTPSKTKSHGGKRKGSGRRAKKQFSDKGKEGEIDTRDSENSSGNKRPADQISTSGSTDQRKYDDQQQENPLSKKQKTADDTSTTQGDQMDVDTEPATIQPQQPPTSTNQPPQTRARSQLPPAIIPSHASWFKIDEVHEIEKKAFPEFFSEGNTDSKNSDSYQQYRNFMINTFRANPSTYLTATACRKVLAGDVVSVMKIHGFLEHWGLINFTIDPRNKPASFLQSMSSMGQGQGTMLFDYTREPQTASERMIMFSNNLRPRPPQQPPTKTSDWTEEETLMLLDALSTYGDNWDAVAQKVKNKTKEQCMLHFLQLPIEDQFLQAVNTTTETEKYEQPLPFADSSNPIMATVAFLASMVSPSVAAAAASAAMKEFRKGQKTQTVEGSSSQHNNNEEQNAPFDVSKLDTKTASAAALGAAAARAEELVIKEEHEIQRMIATLIEKQLKKLELKMKHFENLEGIIAREREQLEEQKRKLFEEKLQLRMNQQLSQQQQQQQQ